MMGGSTSANRRRRILMVSFGYPSEARPGRMLFTHEQEKDWRRRAPASMSLISAQIEIVSRKIYGRRSRSLAFLGRPASGELRF